MRKYFSVAAVGLTIAALVFAPATLSSRAADHLDAPTAKLDGNKELDINDVYVFHPGAPGQQDLSRTVVAMTVSPAAGVIGGTAFKPNANYDLLVDTNGDARPDITIRTTFGQSQGGQQMFTTRWTDPWHRHQVARGWTNTVVEGRGPGQGARVFAGLRDDPFFFDLVSFNTIVKDGAPNPNFCEPGDGDFFLGLNTLSIVVEMPTEWLAGHQVGVWARTSMGGATVDRMGRPAILTVFIPPNPFEPGSASVGNLEDQFNFTAPVNDQAKWRAEIVNSLTLLYSLNDGSDDPSDDAATIQAIANILLPDVLTVDLSQETGFLNGRNLADDVIDAELGLVTEGLLTTDCVANDSAFLSQFPYLGNPNP